MEADIGDIRAPDLIRTGEGYPAQHVRVDPMLGGRLTGPRFGIHRLKPHRAHQPSHPFVVDWVPFALLGALAMYPVRTPALFNFSRINNRLHTSIF